MNYYIRYFDEETLVHTQDEVIEFLSGISEINMNPTMEAEVRAYLGGKEQFPKRYRVRPRIYFIIIKTEAETMQDFKDKKALKHDPVASKNIEQMHLTSIHRGWYEGELDFKRVVVNHLGKCEYRDTTFTIRCIADSPIHCYDRLVNHLKSRVDGRSQFPSAKGKNFRYRFLGLPKPKDKIIPQASTSEDASGL